MVVKRPQLPTTRIAHCFNPYLIENTLNLSRKTNLEEIAEDDDDFNRIPQCNIAPSVIAVPPSFMFYTEEENNNLLDECIQKDIAWSVTNGVPSNAGEDIPLLGC